MGSAASHKFSREAWDLASRQHWVVTRRQLRELGLTEQMVQHRLARGRLHRVFRGVYAVGRAELSGHGRWMAAALACGPRCALSHGSAAAIWGIGVEPLGLVEISIPATTDRCLPGVRIYRRTGLDFSVVGTRNEIPVTSLPRTMIDLAARLDDSGVERMVGEADKRNLIDPESLRRALDGYPGQRGVGRLRDLLGRSTFRLTDSELERRFLRLVRGAGLKIPLTQQRVNGFRVDFHWPDLGLVVETDGLRYHRTAAQQARDGERDQAHTAAGMTPLRFSHAQVYFEPRRVEEVLRLTSERLRVDGALAARRAS